MRPVATRRVRKVLQSKGCSLVGTEGSHEKWETPGGLSDTLVAGDKEQSPGVLRNIQSVFTPEFGAKWLEKELGR
ncbi:MAG: type II toxin-antitoxin system HicA family toxin [Acidimicrobiales bacterium]